MSRKSAIHGTKSLAQDPNPASVSLAWPWSAYRSQLTQTEDEKRALSDLKFRLSQRTHALIRSDGKSAKEDRSGSLFRLFGSFLSLFLLSALFIMANDVIRLQSYREANFANLCGPLADPNSNALTFIKQVNEREQCLNAKAPGIDNITEQLRLLKRSFLSRAGQ